MTNLNEVRRELEKRIGAAESIPFWAVNTRVFLRTGVDLKDLKPQQVNDVALVGKVVQCLAELGYPMK